MAVPNQVIDILFRRSTPLSPNGLTIGGRNLRPLWFDGRFLAARDLKREQDYFLRRQAALGRAGGFGVVHGLLVDQGTATPPSGETIVIHAGQGITPDGRLAMLASDLTLQISDIAGEENLNQQFGLAENPQQPARTRTGLYVLALRPVEFTANPVSSYPSNLSNPRVTQDGDIVEASAATLIPYPNPVNSYDASIQEAALAYQIFVNNAAGALNNSLLPIAMVSIDRNVIQWIDCYLVRRDTGPQNSGVRLDLADPAAQQAFLLQYDAQLQQIVAARQAQGLNANFAAANYFQALPAAGRFPLNAIDTGALTQTFFPQQANVWLSLVPQDELPAIFEDSLSLPPLDLTQPAASFANLSVYVMIAVPRNDYAQLAAQFPHTQLNPALPQTVANRPLLPIPLLLPIAWLPPKLIAPASPWNAAINGQTYGFYVRRRSQPVFPDFTTGQ